MNCPECHRIVFVTQKRCACGAVLPTPKIEHAPPKESMASPVRREVAEMESEVNAYVNLYLAKHPSATIREACIEYMKENGLFEKLPVEWRGNAKPRRDFDDVMDDYRMSQEA